MVARSRIGRTPARFVSVLALLAVSAYLAACESATAPEVEEYPYAPPASRPKYDAIAMAEASARVASDAMTRLGLVLDALARGEIREALVGFELEEGFGWWGMRVADGSADGGEDPADWHYERINFEREDRHVTDLDEPDAVVVYFERHRRDVGSVLGPRNVSNGEIRWSTIRLSLRCAWPPPAGGALEGRLSAHSTHKLYRTADASYGHAWRVEQSLWAQVEGTLPGPGSCVVLRTAGSLNGTIYEGQTVDLGWYGYELYTVKTKHAIALEFDPVGQWEVRFNGTLMGEGTESAPSYLECGS